MGLRMRLFVGVKALIQDKEKILLIKRSDKYKKSNVHGIWDIPGGRINIGEEPETALNREVFEETGLKLKDIKKILDASTIYKDKEKQIIRITYLCTVENTEISLSDEHTEFKWIRPEAIDFKLNDFLIEKCVKKLT